MKLDPCSDVPSVYHTNTTPVESLRNSRSTLPSLFQSTISITCQIGSMEKRKFEVPRLEPFQYHTNARPLVTLRKKKSG